MLLDPTNAKKEQKSSLLSPVTQSSGCLSLSFHYTLHGCSPGAALRVYAEAMGECAEVMSSLLSFPNLLHWANREMGAIHRGCREIQARHYILWGALENKIQEQGE